MKPEPPGATSGLIHRVVLISTVYAVLAIIRHLIYGSGGDLAIFDQAISAASHFEAPTTAMKQPGFSIFGDHFHPIILVMVPLYWLWDNPITLLIGQSITIGIALYLFGKTALEELPRKIAWLLFLALALGIGTQGAAMYDFHEVAVGAPLAAMVGRTFVKGRYTATAWWGMSLLLMKEDAGVFVIGVAMALWFRGRRKTAVAMAVAAVAWTVLVIKVIIPFFNPLDEYFYTAAERPPLVQWMAGNLVEAFLFPAIGTATIVAMFAIYGFLGWRSPLVWTFIGSFLTRAALGNHNYITPFYHYNLLPGIFLAFAAVDQWLTYGKPTRAKLRMQIASWMVAITALLGPWVWSFVIASKDPGTGAEWAMAQVPEGSRVVADVKLTPHMTRHAVVTQLRPPHFLDGVYQPMPDVEWVIVDTQTRTFSGPGWVPAMMAELESDFEEVNTDGRWVILKRV